MKAGKFREDLWYRLNVFPITIPPLRQRKMDIPALVSHFIDRKSKEMNLKISKTLSPGTMQILQDYDWPGNVRELENIVERTLIRNSVPDFRKWLKFDDPTVGVSYETQTDSGSEKSHNLLLDDVMKQHIESVLGLTNGRVHGRKGAADLLGINASTLRNRMKKLGISFGKNREKNGA